MKKALWFLIFTVFLDMIGISILIPVMPSLLGEPSSPHYLLASGSGEAGFVLLGLLMASYPLALFIMAPILGALSDRYGRRPVLLASIAGTAISYFVFAYAIITKNVPLIFISRILDGATGGNISVAQAALTDLTKPEERSKVFGIVGATFGLGFILGPFIGGVLSDQNIVPWFSVATPFIFAGILAIANLSLLYFFFKETIKEKRGNAHIDFLASIKNIASAKGYAEIRGLFLTTFFFNIGFSFFTSFFNVFLVDRFGFTASNIGNFFAYSGLWMIITQTLILRLFVKRWSPAQLLRWSYFGVAVGILLYLVPKGVYGLLAVVPLLSIPNGLQFANFSALLTSRTDERVRGEVLGISSSMSSLAQTIGPVLAGTVAAMAGSWLPIAVSAALLVATGFVFRRFGDSSAKRV